MIKAVTLDLDGTIYLVDHVIEGAVQFIEFLKDKGIRCMFVTNRANRLPSTVAESLRGMGIPCKEDEVLTAAQATASNIEPGRAYIIGEIGLEQALLEKGFELADNDVDYVIVSWDRKFDYDKLKIACNLIYQGARFIATNPDQALPTPEEIYPGTGAIVAAVQAGSDTVPQIIGKPEPLIQLSAADMMGVAPEEVLAIGDNLKTDIPSGASAGMQTALILTGISKRADIDQASVQPDYVAEDYAEMTTIVESLVTTP